MNTTTRAVSALFGLVAVVTATTGCRLPFGGERVTVQAENPALAAAFNRVRDAHGSARLGDIVAESGVGIGEWDRMYSFYSPNTEDEVNAALGIADLNWKGLAQGSDFAMQVFVRGDKVVYAFDDKLPHHSVHAKKYATPDSLVQAKETKEDGPLSRGVVWVLDIQEFS